MGGHWAVGSSSDSVEALHEALFKSGIDPDDLSMLQFLKDLQILHDFNPVEKWPDLLIDVFTEYKLIEEKS